MEQIDWTVRYAARDDLARVNELRAIMCAEHCKPAERMGSILNEK